MIPWIVFAAVWIACGILAYGVVFGYYRGAYPTLKDIDKTGDRICGAMVAMLGPFGLIVGLLFVCSSLRGWQGIHFK